MATSILLLAWIVFVVIGLFFKPAKPFATALFITAVFSGLIGIVQGLAIFFIYSSSAGHVDASNSTSLIYWILLAIFGVWRVMKALDANKPKRPARPTPVATPPVTMTPPTP